jgi:hypothetical protein
MVSVTRATICACGAFPFTMLVISSTLGDRLGLRTADTNCDDIDVPAGGGVVVLRDNKIERVGTPE